MDTPFTSLSRTIPRHAESADARLDIRHDAKDGNRRRKQGRHHPALQGDSHQDITTVSIAALSAFLKELSAVRGPKPQVSDVHRQAQPELPHMRAPNLESARANSAYRSASRTAREPLLETPAEDALPADDREAIVVILEDLHTLAARNVESVTIRRAGTFLESIRQAVAEALAAVPG